MKIILLFISLIFTHCGPDIKLLEQADTLFNLSDNFNKSWSTAIDKHKNNDEKRSEILAIHDSLVLCNDKMSHKKQRSLVETHNTAHSQLEKETSENNDHLINCYKKAIKEIEAYL